MMIKNIRFVNIYQFGQRWEVYGSKGYKRVMRSQRLKSRIHHMSVRHAQSKEKKTSSAKNKLPPPPRSCWTIKAVF